MAADAVIYRLYLDGTLAETSPTPTFELDALTPGTTYHVRVTGVDASGNESTLSDELVVATLAAAAAAGRRALLGVGA